MAWAQGPVQQCPPGSWFCEGGTTQGQVQVQQQPLQPLPGSNPQQPPIVYQQNAPPPPPVVVYQPAPPPVVVVQRPAPPPATPTYVYAPTRRLWRSEWGVNLRLEGAFYGNNKPDGGVNGIGGLGLGVRFRPSPWFGIEGDIDFLGGRDYNDYKRNETAFSVNALLFVNPRDRVQVYFLGGLGGSVAHVVDDVHNASGDWGYFGAQGGGGLEFRFWKHFAMHADLRGFIRGRTDAEARYNPEFVDPNTGKTTNTSGGVLVTGGMTFYF
jgi:opacity protein-like surface antigen